MTYTLPSRSTSVATCPVRQSPAPNKRVPTRPPSPARPEPLCMEQLVNYFKSGCKPEADWRIGTEHEKFAFRKDDFSRATYQDIKHILQQLVSQYGWAPILEAGQIVGCKARGQSVTIETGGQVELSGAPVQNLHQTQAEVRQHLQQAGEAASEIGVQFLGIGYDPRSRSGDLDFMPKQRYHLLHDYLQDTSAGTFGRELLFNTTSTQVNLDFSSESDMVAKLRASLALQPIVSALFSNSVLRQGRESGFHGWRSKVYVHIDESRCGSLPFVFSPDFGIEAYIQWVLDAPMIMTSRAGTYFNCIGGSFRDFIEGRLAALPGEVAMMSDFEEHLSTTWPDVRLKKYLEMRGADCGSEAMIVALPALWVGLLYDATALAECLQLISGWSVDDLARHRREIPLTGFAAHTPDGTVGEVATELVRIARGGLRRRGLGEAMYLAPLEEIVATQESHATAIGRLFRTEWNGSVTPLLQHMAL